MADTPAPALLSEERVREITTYTAPSSLSFDGYSEHEVWQLATELLSLRQKVEELESDHARMNEAQRIMLAAHFDFPVSDDQGTRMLPIVALEMKPGTRIGADLRAFLDMSRRPEESR